MEQRTGRQNLSEAENNFLSHVQMWGSESYPIRKVGNGKWIWEDFWGVRGSPEVYKTRREGHAAISRYIDVLLDKLAGRV